MKASGGVVGQQGYSKHRKCSFADVTRAIASGKLLKSVSRDEDGRIRIDVGIADQEWEVEQPAAEVDEQLDPEELPSISDSRKKFEHFKALGEELAYRQKAGTLLAADEVRRVYFKKARALRDRLMAIPDRIAAIAAAESDPINVKQLLRGEIAAAIHEVSREVGDGEI